jgi:hypothetical protein
MPYALQTISGFFTAGAAGTGVATPMVGDTFTVQSFAQTAQARLEQMWATGASTDFVRVRSPRMHDANQGIRLQVGASQYFPLLPDGIVQPLYPVDTPIVEIDETGAATGGISLMYGYDDLPGVQPRLAHWAEIAPRIKQISGVQVNLGAIAGIGQYSAGSAINSSFDNFEAGLDYALLGYTVSAARLAIVVQGQDTGNLKVGGPGINDSRDAAWWFYKMSWITGRPFIPVIAANNKGSTLVYQTDNAASAAQNITLLLAELG